MEKKTKKGRPRSFNEERILEDSMCAFWKDGFSGTNYDKLEQATGLKRQSLVYAFGDKRDLFLKSLSHYYSTRVGKVIDILERESSGLDNIRCVFDAWLTSATDEARRGCLIVNTHGQFGSSDAEVAAIINGAVETLRKAFATSYESAQQSGEVINSLSPSDLASLTMATGNGALLHVHCDENIDNVMTVLNSLLVMVATDHRGIIPLTCGDRPSNAL